MLFLLDEDLPRSTSRILTENGYKAVDVRDCGLRGRSDREIFAYALDHEATLITADLGFGNILAFPPGSHHGIIICHFPNEVSTSELGRQILSFLGKLSVEEIKGNLAIIEPGKIRLRKK